MLKTLKAMLESAEEGIDTVYDLAQSQDDDDLKSRFLDDPGTVVVGAENDPAIKKLISLIPESDDMDSVTQESLDTLIENEIPSTRIHGDRTSIMEDVGEIDLNDDENTDEDDDDDEDPVSVDGDLNDMTEAIVGY